MTVSVTDIITPRPWRGYDDPGLPSGAYIQQQVAIGDLSGGSQQCIFVFKPINLSATGRYYNIEQLDAHKGLSATANGFIFTTNFDQEGQLGIGVRQWRFELQSTSLTSAAIHYQQGAPPMPLFLGQSTRSQFNQTSITIGTPNVDGEAFTVTIQGFVWEPRSIQSPGGLRRPLEALYGR